MNRFVALLLCASCVLLGVGSVVRAEAPTHARHQRLEGLDEEERKLLAPLMERGPVALVEFAEQDKLPEVLVAGYVEAPAALVAKIIANPRDYPKFMATLDHVEVLSESPTKVAYKWTWQSGMLFLEGENHLTSFPPPADHPELGYRITVNSERGALGEGRLQWRVFPAGKGRSMLVLAMRVDMRDANVIMRQLDAAARSINRSINLALCHVMMLGTKREAERQAGKVSTPGKVVFGPPDYDPRRFAKLLRRADLLVTELTKTGLGKITIFGRTGLKAEQLRPVMTEPEAFGKALVPGSYTRVVKREAGVKTFEWGINLPLVGTSGTMQMVEDGDTLRIDATDGALKGGKWRFMTPSLPNGEALVVGYAVFNIANTTWLIQKLASVDPAMGHGLAAASQVMMLRALRKRAHDEAKLAKQARAAEAAASDVAEGQAPAQASAPAAAVARESEPQRSTTN